MDRWAAKAAHRFFAVVRKRPHEGFVIKKHRPTNYLERWAWTQRAASGTLTPTPLPRIEIFVDINNKSCSSARTNCTGSVRTRVNGWISCRRSSGCWSPGGESMSAGFARTVSYMPPDVGATDRGSLLTEARSSGSGVQRIADPGRLGRSCCLTPSEEAQRIAPAELANEIPRPPSALVVAARPASSGL
jgi:hypothetical protein